MNDYDVLRSAEALGIIDLQSIQLQIDMYEKKKYLEMHTNSVWQGKNGYWYTTLPATEEHGRKMVRRLNKEAMKKLNIFLCIMILALCVGCGASGDVSEPATEGSTTKESSAASDTTEEKTLEEVMTEEAVTEDTASKETESESTAKYNAFIDDYASFEVTSTSLNNGVWDDVISNTDKGENKSPQLAWNAVDGAGLYVIIMDDPVAGDFMHWISDNVTETSLVEGWADKSEYVGPYPPTGSTHTYEVFVVALKAPVERVKGALGPSNSKFEENFKALDIDAQGNSGNIIAVGRISGTFSY